MFVPQVVYRPAFERDVGTISGAGAVGGLGTVSLGVPFQFNPLYANSPFRPSAFGANVNATGRGVEHQINLNVTNRGISLGATLSVDYANADNLASMLLPGTRTGGTNVYLEGDTFFLRAEGQIFRSRMVQAGFDKALGMIPLPGGVSPTIDVSYDFRFMDPERFWNNTVVPSLPSLISAFNGNIDRMEDRVQLDSAEFTRRVRATFDAAAANDRNGWPGQTLAEFAGAWPTRTVLELYYMAEAQGVQELSLTLPFGWGGAAGGGGRWQVEVGRRAEEAGNFYIVATASQHLGTWARNEATWERQHFVVNESGENVRVPTTIRYNFRETLNGPTAEWENGYTFHSGEGETERFRVSLFSSEAEMQQHITDFTNGYKANCFVAGTPILMADGKTKPIEQIEVGDKIAAFDESDPFGPLTLLYVHSVHIVQKLLLLPACDLRLTIPFSHLPVYLNLSWKPAKRVPWFHSMGGKLRSMKSNTVTTKSRYLIYKPKGATPTLREVFVFIITA
jgi:hypothetical protein